MKMWGRIIVLLVVFPVPLALAAGGSAVDVKAWVEDNVPELMREARMPGFSIAVVEDGETIYADGFGARDSEKSLPATADTLYGIGSVTKSFVAISILQLAEQGKLDLDDPVSKYIPFELGLPDQPIKIRHFLSHSSGLPSLATSSVLIGHGLGEDTGVPMASSDDFFRFVNAAQGEIAFEPGQHFFYNNAAWRMLGAIVQNVSGMPFHEYVTQNVIRPLGMQRTTFDTAALFADADHLMPHRQTSDGPQPANFPYPNPADVGDFSFLSAAGGIASSVNEMTHYVNMLINQGEHDGVSLVDQRSMREMQTLQIRRPDSLYGVYGYGFGLGITPDFLGAKLVGHGGSVAVSTAQIAFVPEQNIGVVVMGNSGGMNYAIICESILAILMGEEPSDVVPALGVRARLKEFVGSYTVYRGIESLEVVDKGGLLYIKDGDYEVPLIPEDETLQGLNFNLLGSGRRTPVEFRRGENGRMDMLLGRYVYHQD